MKKLIQIRNQLFNIYSEMKETVEGSAPLREYKKSDALNMHELINRLNEKGHLSPHQLWDIPLKRH